MTLADALASAADEVPDIERADAEGAVEWRLAGRAFAGATDGTAEFRLPGAIGRAALGTPDTGPSPRGAEWVTFAPGELDQFALDRARAWFAAAARHAVDR